MVNVGLFQVCLSMFVSCRCDMFTIFTSSVDLVCFSLVDDTPICLAQVMPLRSPSRRERVRNLSRILRDSDLGDAPR